MFTENQNTYKQFGNFVRYTRLKRKLSQGEVVEMIGVTQAYYHYIEYGNRQISLEMALHICDVLHLDFNEFLTSLKKKQPSVIRPGT